MRLGDTTRGDKMRRQIIILLVALFVVCGTAFGGYPADYYGDWISDGCVEVEAWISDYHDRNPWGMRDPTGTFFLFGEMCATGGVVNLNLTEFASRHCREAPWGTRDNEPICYAWYLRDWAYGKFKLAFEENANGTFYFSGVWLETDRDDFPVFYFDALTWDSAEMTGRFVQGVWHLVATIFLKDDDRFTRSTWTVRERQTPIMNPMRRSTLRIVP